MQETESDFFEVNLDVKRLNPEDISVELHDNCIIVNTRKVKEGDNSIVARKFSKRVYPLDMIKYNKDSLISKFEDNGMLLIRLFRKKEV